MTGRAALAGGVVQVRLSGGQGDAAAVAGLLAAVPGVEILTGPDGPYPNRRQPGHRLYLTVRLAKPPDAETTRNRTRPAAWPATRTRPGERNP